MVYYYILGDAMKVEYDHCKVELDPFRKYPNANYVELLQYLHVPLTFTTTILGSTGLMHETLAELYQFGVYNMKGEIISQGVYKYPGDPDLYPLM